MLFRQFSNTATCTRDVAKILIYYFNVYFSSNPEDKVQNYGKLKDKSVPYFQPGSGSGSGSGPGPLDWRTTIHWNVEYMFFQHPWYMLENCWNSISTFGHAPIQGTTHLYGEIQMKPGSQNGLYKCYKRKRFRFIKKKYIYF